MNSRSKKLLIATVPTIIIVALLGIGIAVGRYSQFFAIKRQISSLSFGTTLGEILTDDQEKGVSPAYFDGEELIDDLSNISWAIPNIFTPFVGDAPEPGKHNNAHINSMQFRADNELAIPKPINVYRIFITGGSTAFGSGAPSQEKTIAGYLSRFLNDKLSSTTGFTYEVMTLANPAWASTHERIIIENRLSEFEPDMVISISGNNDVHWGYLGKDILWFQTYASSIFFDLLNTIYEIFGFSKMPDVTVTAKEPVSPALVADRLLKNVTLSSYVLSLENANYVYILQPTIDVSKKQLSERENRIRKDKERMKYFTESYYLIDSSLSNFKMDNFKYIDLSNLFDNLSYEEEIFIDSYHFGDIGNEIIAKETYKYISEIIERDEP